VSDFRPPPRKKNALDEGKLKIIGEPQNGSKRRPTLGWSIVKNHPRIDVWTNIDGDKNNGNIRAAMDSPTFFVLLTFLKQAIEAEPGFKQAVENMGYTWFQNKRSEETKVLSTTHIGKDKNGIVYISVVAHDRPKIKFDFRSGIYHKLRNADGSDFTKEQDSIAYASAYLGLLSGLVPAVLEGEYVEPPPRDMNGTGGNGGGGWKGNNNNNSQAPKAAASNDFDDDIPF